MQLICHKDKKDVQTLLQKHVIDWYHTILCHPGMDRTKETIGHHLWCPIMQEQITTFVKACPTCQLNKKNS